MSHRIPQSALTMMSAVYRKIFPEVDRQLSYWRKKAENIPNDELRGQALASIEDKRFHCQGGAVFALLGGHRWKEAVHFIVAYQTISDYLDNLCDRSTSLDPCDFRMLHKAMQDALSPNASLGHYYRFRQDDNDGEYLSDLVRTCQKAMQKLEAYDIIQSHLVFLESLYEDLQVHKHVQVSERVPRLSIWHQQNQAIAKDLAWYEFSAATGSTLGIFCLVSYALRGHLTQKLAEKITYAYFPFVQALHIMLDYYIDQREDDKAGDLNFCSFYDGLDHLTKRMNYFIQQSRRSLKNLPNRSFHDMISQGLVGLYLADAKVTEMKDGKTTAELLLKQSGARARFFYWNARFINRFKT